MIKIPEPQKNSRLGEVPYSFNGRLPWTSRAYVIFQVGIFFVEHTPPEDWNTAGGTHIRTWMVNGSDHGFLSFHDLS